MGQKQDKAKKAERAEGLTAWLNKMKPKASVMRGKKKVTLYHVERRPSKGMARECNNDNEQYDWHPEVEAEAVRLANNPVNDKRDTKVFTELEAKYQHRMADGKEMMPTLQAVTNLCKREWGKRQKQKKKTPRTTALATSSAQACQTRW